MYEVYHLKLVTSQNNKNLCYNYSLCTVEVHEYFAHTFRNHIGQEGCAPSPTENLIN